MSGAACAMAGIGASFRPSGILDETVTAINTAYTATFLAALPAAALLLFDRGRGVINCGLCAPLTLALITVVTRAKSTLSWQVARTVHRTSHAGDAVVWSGRSRTAGPPVRQFTITMVIGGRSLPPSPDRPPPIGSP